MGFHLESGGERVAPFREIDDLGDAVWAALETSEDLGQEPVHVVDESGESVALIESRSDEGQARRNMMYAATHGLEGA